MTSSGTRGSSLRGHVGIWTGWVGLGRRGGVRDAEGWQVRGKAES